MLSLGALGVVFGDIGTSPLYSLRECFGEYGIPASPENVIGILSLIFWTLIIVICVKYMAFVMRADNKGEGGILSLMALAVRSQHTKDMTHRRWIMTILGLFGAALLYGDGVITPAISVLSAMEGLTILTPQFEPFIIPITIFVMNALFLMQKYGTGRIGVIFGPILLIWFGTLAVLGINGIMLNPHIFEALMPNHALEFFYANGLHGFLVLGSVFLVVTGGEALYADMGHFGKRPIRLAWFFVALPALVLNYFGQGALLLSTPEAISNPFYLLAPKWAILPMVVLSTLATVIASQALITGVFSITRQAIQLGFCPRISIIHTSSQEIGQIYVPAVNWSLFVGVIWLVLTFKTSSNLAAAYGIAVTGTMIITTILAYEVARQKWNWSFMKAASIFGAFLVMDLAFFGANIHKIPHGGWVALMIGAVIYLLMTTWQKGRQVLFRRLKERSMPVEDFCQKILREPPLRVPGTAIYMAGDPWGVPVPLLHNLKHNRVLHQRVAILTIQTREVPFVSKKDRVSIQEVIPNFYRILAYYGFMETPKMKHILEACRQRDINFNVSDTTFVLGRETIIAVPGAPKPGEPGMPHWRERLFAVMSKNAQRPTAFFRIPPNQVIEVGIQIEI
ncbi:potassium transporter Kup [Bdellovibrio svalbardensis]|uniref:Probable potassium transport system protein Kup n=1 Tax=Bdellovibrio svalbardensis TaxID=2972972 RepID=A0ABT6DIE2_9BACT|nr:potassium transporter Kup [Bdellovibrio svalbardensis]MDG0816611.1 potassium transporter Kup [Bdellovibrio svalbardensis]